MAPKKTRIPKGKVHVAAQSKRRWVTIDILPDDVLLEIFDLYVDPTRGYGGEHTWLTLAHVCRKWRNIVLESPLRLNLRIRCYLSTHAREKLDVWPALPIVLLEHGEYDEIPEWDEIDIAAAFEQNHRICQIHLSGVTSLEMEEILAAMHKSFPLLTDLSLCSDDETPEMLVDPDLFLGGSAPCLRSLHLACIPFPGLPKLLLSATHLTDLRLHEISQSGYISPETMVSCVSALTRLESLVLDFESAKSEHRRPPPPTRTPLPALTWLRFHGSSEYLEDLVVRIDTPLLNNLEIYFFYQPTHDTAQVAQFINRTPKLKAYNKADVVLNDSSVHITLQVLEKVLAISYEVANWAPLASVVQVCTSSLSQAFNATIERLDIDLYARWRGDFRVENNLWLELLRSFTSVKSLYLSRVIVPYIAPALREPIGGRLAGVLPALETLFLEDLNLSGPVQEAIGSFVYRRQFSGHPVAVSRWNKGQVEL